MAQLEHARRDQAGARLLTRTLTAILVAILAAAAALLFWAGTGTIFFNGDDLSQITTISWSPEEMLTPSNGNLILVSRLVFHSVASLFGPDYGVLRAIGVLAVIAVDALFFCLARRRVGPTLALAGTLVVAFLGTAWEAMLWPGAQLSMVIATAAGLGAFLALEEPSSVRDAAGAALLLLSLASLSIGLCFAVGVGASVLLRDDRWRRAWIFIVPVAIWGAWWIWSAQFGQGSGSLANLPRIPIYDLESLVAVTASLGGAIGFGGSVGFDTPPARTAAGSAVALILIVGFASIVAWRAKVGAALRRLRLSGSILPPLLALLSFWSFTALAGGSGRPPQASRYMLPGVVLLLLVVAEAIRGVEIRGRLLMLVFGGAVAIAALNVMVLLQARDFFADYSTNAKAQLAMVEVARNRVDPAFNPALATPSASGRYLNVTASAYLGAVAHYGSFADSIPQVQASSEPVRERADQILSAMLGLGATPAHASPTPRRCRSLESAQAALGASVPLFRGGAVVRARRGGPLVLGRFASRQTAMIGVLTPGQPEEVAIPADRVSRPWRAGAPASGGLTVCALRRQP